MDNSYPIDRYNDKTIVVDKSQYYKPKDFLIPSLYESYIDKVILPRGIMIDRIEKMAEDILNDHNGMEVVFLVVLKGAMTFASYLSEKIGTLIKNKSSTFKYRFEYITISSYQDDKSTGNIKIKTDEGTLNQLTNKHVLVVEDIYDSGQTLNAFYELLRTNYNVLSLKSVFLLQKMNPQNLKYDFNIEYLGFLVPDDFVIGFGMDYNQEFRELGHLCCINKFGIDTFKVKE